MELCKQCGNGLEWGKIDEEKEIIYFWRCSWCGYKGDVIVRIPKE